MNTDAIASSGPRQRRLRAFASPGYGRLWSAAMLLALAQWMERLTVGWFVLDVTGSVFLTALSFAMQNIPQLLLGPIAGAVSDRVYRPRVLRRAWTVRALVDIAFALAIALGGGALPVLLLVGVSGAVRTFETPAVQTLISDLVPPGDRGHATGLYSVGVRVVGVVGTLSGGVIIDLIGPAPVFLAPAALALIGAAVIGALQAPASAAIGASGIRGIMTDTVSGFRALAALPVVAALIGLTLFVEIFGFAYLSLLPAIAERALEVDAVGLGALSAAAALGGVVGALAVSAVGDASYRGRLLLGVSFGLGAGLAALGTTHAFGVALALCIVIGATSAMFDALQWVLLQANVPDELRGRVIGAWVWAIGFGWAGHLGLGALGDIAGIEAAVVTAGVAVLAVACVATVTAARLKPA